MGNIQAFQVWGLRRLVPQCVAPQALLGKISLPALAISGLHHP